MIQTVLTVTVSAIILSAGCYVLIKFWNQWDTSNTAEDRNKKADSFIRYMEDFNNQLKSM